MLAPLIGIAGLWWKLTTLMATKAENAELRADIREIRQLLYKNVVDTGSKGDTKDVDRN